MDHEVWRAGYVLMSERTPSTFQLLAATSLIFAGACATVPISGDPAVPVFAVAETEPVQTENEDAADDPSIWRNAEDPAASLIVATDKKAGLYVYDLDGKARHFITGGDYNNVDLAEIGGGVVVFASNRADRSAAQIDFFRLDTGSAKLIPLGSTDAGPGEAYGICGRNDGDRLLVYSAPKSGVITEYAITFDSEAIPSAQLLRTMRVPSQPEGCAVDPRNGILYIGEEVGGVWRFDAGQTDGELIAPVDNRNLVADLEGLALVPEGEAGGWLYASSQGDNTFVRYRLPDMQPAGRFRIAQGEFGPTEETDGIEVVKGDFGPRYPGGLFVAQDGVNGDQAQNFKLVPLASIEAALGS